MKIVSFPHYTCGGLLCDILNDTFSEVGPNGGISSIHHNLGKIGDLDTVMVEYNHAELVKKLELIKTTDWIGTHCWLGDIDFPRIEKIINITTTTYRSKFYRWARAYYHYYSKAQPWKNLQGMEEIDKQRETAKNYLVPFQPIFDQRVLNLEFAEVVDCAPAFILCAGKDYKKHYDRWRSINHFLYDKDLWQSPLALRFYEAEHEINLKKYYVYE